MISTIFFILLSSLIPRLASPESVTIVFFGDSITAGYGVGTELAYPAKVGVLLEQDGHKVEIVNAGLSGETSAGGLTRIAWILNRPLDIFLLELGANDGLRGLPVDQTEKNLQAIIDMVLGKNPEAKIIIAGMRVPPNMGPDYADAFKDIFARIARQNNAILVPFLLHGVAGDASLNQPDGIHPNAKGHEIVAKTVFNQLKNML